jgi:hypothetical protein
MDFTSVLILFLLELIAISPDDQLYLGPGGGFP